MKLMILTCLPMLTLCSAGSQRKELVVHSELNTAIHDLIIAASTADKKPMLSCINMSILGGSQLKHTDYTLHDIINVVPREELEAEARKNKWYGILTLLGIWRVPGAKE